MSRKFNDVNFAPDLLKRIIKNSLSVGTFAKSAEVIAVKYTNAEGMEIETTYLAAKMIGVEKESLWLGYKVQEELANGKVEIDVNSLLWVYIDSTILKKQIRVNKLEEYNVADILKNSSTKELPIKIGDNTKNIEYHTRCISQLNATIGEIYSKARIHSFLKMLTNFSTFEYNFFKSENADEKVQAENQGKLILKSRYVPLNIEVDKSKSITTISIYVNSLKDGSKQVGLWIVVPLNENGFMDLDNAALVAGLSSKNISVNSTCAIVNQSSQIEVKHLSKETLAEKSNNDDLSVWISKVCDNYGISKFLAANNVADFVEKFEKSKDLLCEDVVENIYFTNVEHFTEYSVKFSNAQAKELGVGVKEKVKSISTVLVEKDPVGNEVDQRKDQSADLLKENDGAESITNTDPVVDPLPKTGMQVESPVAPTPLESNSESKEVTQILNESLDEDGIWSFKVEEANLVFEHTHLHCKISFAVSQMRELPNIIFNEMLQLSIDPYTINDAFESVGVKFKKYSYAQVRKLISEVPDEVLNNYTDLENYYDLVEAEKHNRSIQKG